MAESFNTRLIVVPVIRRESGEVLICKMPPDRGVFPGQWGLPGGGVEPGEYLDQALRREVFEELGTSVLEARPLLFKDGTYTKILPNGETRKIYMVFLLYECRIDEGLPICLNEEFCAYQWAMPSSLGEYDLNVATRETFASIGLLKEIL